MSIANSHVRDPLYSCYGGDPDLGDLVTDFVERMPDRARRLQGHYDNANWSELERAAHQLKGAAGSYGFDILTTEAARLEQSVAAGADSLVIQEALEIVILCCERCQAGPTP